MGDHPGFGRSGIFVGQSDERGFCQFLDRRRIGAIQQIRIAQRIAVRPEVDDQGVVGRTDRPLRVGQVTGTSHLDMPFATGHDKIPLWIDSTLAFGFQNRPQTAACHHLGDGDAAGLQERGGQIHQIDKIVHHTSPSHARTSDSQADAGSKTVQVALAVRKTRRAVVAADDDQRVVQLASLLHFVQQQTDGGIKRHDLAEVVHQVFPHLMHVRQERRHLALQVVRVQSPERFSRAFDPLAMHIRWAEPVAERLIVLAISQKRAEISECLVVQDLFRLGDRHALGDQTGRVLRKLVEPSSGLLVAELLSSVRSILGGSRAPDFVGLADVVPGIFQQQRVRRDRRIPNRALQDGPPTGPPEVLAG